MIIASQRTISDILTPSGSCYIDNMSHVTLHCVCMSHNRCTCSTLSPLLFGVSTPSLDAERPLTQAIKHPIDVGCAACDLGEITQVECACAPCALEGCVAAARPGGALNDVL